MSETQDGFNPLSDEGPGTPSNRVFDEVVRRSADELGVILLTVNLIDPTRSWTSRVHTTHPATYPVGGRKRLDPSQTAPVWMQRVIIEQEPFVGSDRVAVRSFFFDAETIESLGCGSIINTPIVHEGVTIGSVNFLAAEHRLGPEQVSSAVALTRLLTPEAVALHSADVHSHEACGEAAHV